MLDYQWNLQWIASLSPCMEQKQASCFKGSNTVTEIPIELCEKVVETKLDTEVSMLL